MKIKQILLIIALAILSSNLYARKPAVEDFVGVETESYKEVPNNARVEFNFGEKISKNSIQLDTPTNQMNIFSFLTLLAFTALPFFMWFGLTKKDSQTTQVSVEVTQAEQISEENVKKLSDYRDSESSETEKKAS